MEEWREVALGEIANVKGGKRLPSGATLTDSRTSHPYLRIVDFKDGGVDQSNLMYVPEEVFPKIKNYIVNSGDLYISIVGTIGLIGAIPTSLHHANLTENAAKICEFTADIDARFLSFFLRSQAGQEAIRSLTVGSTQPKLALFRIKDIRVPLPPLPEQHAIAATLGALDDKIELNRRMCETLESMARALFRDWFVDFGPTRAKMAGTAPYLAEDLWSLFPDRLDDEGKPKGWEAGTLNDVADLNPESWAVKKAPRTVAYVDLANTKWGNIDKIEQYDWPDAPSRARRILKPGDTIVGTVRPGNGSFSYVGEDGLTGSTGFAVLRAKSSRDRGYVWCAATSSENIERLTHLADGGAYPAVRPEVVASTAVILPSIRVREAFDNAVSIKLSLIEANKLESRTLAETRDLLLPRLMSGALRVTDAEHLLEEVL